MASTGIWIMIVYNRIGFVSLLFAFGNLEAQAQYTFTLLGDGVLSSRAYGAGGTQQVGTADSGDTYGRTARIWSGTTGIGIDLSPGGVYLESGAYATDGTLQAGWARQGAGGGSQKHAATWGGSAATFSDLNPVGYYTSEAFAVDGDTQVGYAGSVTTSYDHAMLWHGDHDHFDDLHPTDKPMYDATRALDAAGGVQVGYANGSFFGTHATLWAGSYSSFLDLNPTGTLNSIALATDGSLQGGWAQVGSAEHAFLWSGSAESAMDLNPAGKSFSVINDMAAGYQVGGASGHAYRWTGTAASAYDLHSFVSGGYTFSTALGIGADGTIVGEVGYLGGSDFSWACMWTPVPEPSAMLVLAGAASIFLRRRRNLRR